MNRTKRPRKEPTLAWLHIYTYSAALHNRPLLPFTSPAEYVANVPIS